MTEQTKKSTTFKVNDIFTSTGLKFFCHKDQLERYKKDFPSTIISTHISPEGSCNLNCEYCSVSKRKKNERISLVVINEYLLSVARLGCKAIIITGGGEPTLYPAFKLILQTIKKLGMEYALITNGTTISQQNLFVYDFSWVRISVNNNPFWIKRFMENKHKFLKTTIVGLSFIYSGKNKEFKPADLLLFADHINAEYIRLLPDCMPENDKLEESYSELRSWLGKRHDKRFFIQEKKHLAPKSVICHQAYFRPYLSELNGGTVFPCDSIPLNSSTGQFNDKYALCKPEEIYKFLKKDIIQDFNCLIDCHGCVFTHNVDLLHDFMTDPEPKWITKEVKHKNFV